ncbi:Membrane protein insertase YidC [Defluviimonas aquaemixtae]|uniref:Membrane protein insertase YidC n=1 Tax=Albidovulum aquaemixtae TaxID=1542388 RepID=A0A2R8B1W9_9RHOB|nr:membrane protein insertase YidC [Defluviimonas aquaemixtae]SPH16540.1 Membrane protein insertase YidC [Defluviimonas aquaemixtae]
MDDQNKNLILATVLSFLVILIWYTLFPPPTPEPEPQVPAETAQSETPAPATTGETGTSPEIDAAAAEIAAAPRVAIDTPRLSGSISLLGGRIDDLLLKDYKTTLDKDAPNVRLLAPVGGSEINAAKPYYAVYGWVPAGGLDPALVPNAKTLWQVDEGAMLAPGQPITLFWDNGAGLVFKRRIAVDANYLFTITQSVENRGGEAVRLAPYGIVARHGLPKTQSIYVLHEGVVRKSDGELQEIDYDDLPDLDIDARERTPADPIAVAENGWIGFTDKYWMTTLAPAPGQAFTSVAKYVPGADIYQTEARLPVMEVAPGASADATTMLFAGAKEWEAIKHYQDDTGIQGFVDSIDWGWFFFLTKPMFQLLHWLHGAIGNMGWAIIALTVIIKLIVFPLARKSYVSMAKMKELQPEMEALKEAAGDDRQKMQKGMMELYKKNKVNPASGCLPILLQIPIFFSLYKVIYVTIELYHAPWFGWIRDLSAPDPSSILNLFGLLPWATPEPGSLFFIFSLGILPILLGVSMWFQQKLNPAPTDPTQQMIFAWMPWIFMFMLGGFASGLVLYWIANNIITFVQQYSIMSMHGKRPDLFGNIREGFKRRAREPEKK